jgi:DNA polymerase-3 subunit epsilon
LAKSRRHACAQGRFRFDRMVERLAEPVEPPKSSRTPSPERTPGARWTSAGGARDKNRESAMAFLPLFETAAHSARTGASLWTSPVLFLDAQATASHPASGSLIEVGWAWAPAALAAELSLDDVRAHVLAGARALPPAVARLTGLRTADLAGARDAPSAWRELEDRALALGPNPPPLPSVVHFARFEEPFLRDLFARHGRAAAFPLHLVCTHAIARRLLAHLPRRTLRALAGYLGRSVPPLRRSDQHVLATAFVWHHLVPLLADAGVRTFDDLAGWLEAPPPRHARVYPMPRERRLRVPDAPGVYRLLRENGDVLYVGKARSLRRRVNSHFTGRAGRDERALEMLTQARDLSCTSTETALEAALLEADEIKRLEPPYNVALAAAGRAPWFSSGDFRSVQDHADERHPIGPFPSPASPHAIAAFVEVLSGAPPGAATRGRCVGVEPRWAPDPGSFAAGLGSFLAGQPSLVRGASPRTLVRAGAGLWRRRLAEGARPVGTDERVLAPQTGAGWSTARVEEELNDSLLRAAHAVRRARWLCRLAEASLRWTEPRGRRHLVIEKGEITRRDWIGDDEPPWPPPGHARTMAERRADFDIAALDRLRVLGTELRRLLGEAAAVELRLGPGSSLDRSRLARVLAWV